MSKLEIERAYFTFDRIALVGALALRGSRIGEFFFRQAIFSPTAACAPKMKFARVRDEGRRVTATIKLRTSGPYEEEDEVTISDYDTGVRMFGRLGLEKKYYLEKLREIWVVGDYEVVFDTYPGLPPYLEIEGPDEEALVRLAAGLGLTDEAQDIGAGELYLLHYGIPLERPQGDLTFENVGPTLGPLATRGRALFEERLDAQRRRVAALAL